MSLLVVGSTAFDTVETPHGIARDCLGGSSTYFALAARLFTDVRLVSVVGDDFPPASRQLLESRGIDLTGVEVKPGKTFRWHGRYSADMNSRSTIDVQLNTFGDFKPKVPAASKDTPFVFLANGSPGTQISVLEQMQKPKFCVADTMDLWIERERDGLLKLLQRIDGIIVNDAEARMLTGRNNLIDAGRAILDLGPRLAIVKKGEHGSFFVGEHSLFLSNTYPVREIVDPTGAGDAYAGGVLGYLARQPKLNEREIARAMGWGSVVGSFYVEGFGPDGLKTKTMRDLNARYNSFVKLCSIP